MADRRASRAARADTLLSMLVYAGIDEAGYGPMLGPLCVGCTTFVLPSADPADGPPDLWKALSKAVTRAKRDRRSRIAVDDSKRLKGSGTKAHPLRHLERGVLSFLAAAGELPADDDALLAALATAAPDCPWYADALALPVSTEADALRIAAARLRRALTSADLSVGRMACTVIDAGPFNASVARMGNKAHVNLHAVLEHLDTVWRRWPTDHPRVIVDRQGGRTRYREELQLAFPDASIRIVREAPNLSRYCLNRNGSELTVSFATEAEDRHLPVALASMVAKYTRELLMTRLNTYFAARVPELKPTAGYVQDARRYLDDLGDTIVDGLPGGRTAFIRTV